MDHKVTLILLLWLALQIPLCSLVGGFIKIGSGEAEVAKSRRNDYPDDVPIPALGPRMVCTICGAIGANMRAETPQDSKREAIATWEKLLSCVEALPDEQAAPLWQMVQAKPV